MIIILIISFGKKKEGDWIEFDGGRVRSITKNKRDGSENKIERKRTSSQIKSIDSEHNEEIPEISQN